jgi:hypothetical protein
LAPERAAVSGQAAGLRVKAPEAGGRDSNCEAARRIKRRNPDATPAAIAAQLGEGATEADVALALATLRTRNPRRSRTTVNATLEAGQFVEREGRNGEPRWMTLDRLLGELAQLRAIVAGWSVEIGQARRGQARRA